MGEEHLYDKERLKYQNGREEDRGKVGCYHIKRSVDTYKRDRLGGVKKEGN